MGGIVARLMVMLPNYVPNSIVDLFTLSTPHKEPPLPFYRSMDNLYAKINNFWKANHHKNGLLRNLTFISMAGGTRDTTLDSSLTDISSIASPELSLNLFASGTPHIWSSADHEGLNLLRRCCLVQSNIRIVEQCCLRFGYTWKQSFIHENGDTKTNFSSRI